MFDSMIQQARQVTTSGLCRGELEGVVAGVGRVIATTPSTLSAAGSRTRPSGTAAAKTTRCSRNASCSCQRLRTSPTTVAAGFGACWMWATPTARSVLPGAAEETLRAVYDIADAVVGAATVDRLSCDLQDPAMPAKINRLGRTIWRWRDQIRQLALPESHQRRRRGRQHLVKRVNRAAFGLPDFGQLLNPGPAVCRQTQLGAARHPHSDLKRGEPSNT